MSSAAPPRPPPSRREMRTTMIHGGRVRGARKGGARGKFREFSGFPWPGMWTTATTMTLRMKATYSSREAPDHRLMEPHLPPSTASYSMGSERNGGSPDCFEENRFLAAFFRSLLWRLSIQHVLWADLKHLLAPLQ